MVQMSVRLPCRTHSEDCNEHKFWRSQQPPLSRPLSTHTSRFSRIIPSIWPRSRRIRRKVAAADDRNYRKSKIQTLPLELLQQIASYLTLEAEAAFTLTCHDIAHAIGTQALANYYGKTASWYKKLEFLDVLLPDFSPVDWWRCNQCMKIHRRSWVGPSQQGLLIARWWKMRRQIGELRYGPLDDPIYIIGFDEVQLVMDRHFHRKRQEFSNGICVESLKCSGSRTYSIDSTTKVILHYTFEPRIVIDRLLLRATYRFQYQRTMFFLPNVSVEDVSVTKFMGKLGFRCCSHLNVNDMNSLEGYNEGRRYKSCPFCPTEFEMKIDNGDRESTTSLSVNVWQNLGSGRTPKDPKWQHLARSKSGRGVEYHRNGESIREAYQRIYCSTRKEFENQWEVAVSQKPRRIYSEKWQHYVSTLPSCFEPGVAPEDFPLASPYKSLPSIIAQNL